jgi:(E)-4-hydroxy-3-methylbut-2-enyl-diphosphate synthase
MIEKCDYDRIVISIKSSDVLTCIRAHELLAEKTDYPLHVGITEAGTVRGGTVKSAVGIGTILYEGIGDTIRVSLSGDPAEEVWTAKQILRDLQLRRDGIEIVACPTCGRTKIDLIGLAEAAEKMAEEYPHLHIRVAVMGCAVNGPGEAREADIGIAGGNGEGLLFKKGVIVRKMPESELLSALKQELDNWR